jgi:hypothetical protein
MDAVSPVVSSAVTRLHRALVAEGTSRPIPMIRTLWELEGTVHALVSHAITDARRQGHTWAEIGRALRLSEQEARQLYWAIEPWDRPASNPRPDDGGPPP